MQINITRKNAGLSDSLKGYIEEKLGVLTKHYGKIIDTRVLIDMQGKDQLVEINLRVSGHSMFAKSQDENLRTAFDSSVEKIDRQLKKLKGKIRRKALTPEEAVMSGKVIVEEEVEEPGEQLKGPVLILRPEGSAEESEQEEEEGREERTGT